MRKGILLAAVVAAMTSMAGPAAALDVNVQNASPDVIHVTVVGSQCVWPTSVEPQTLPPGAGAQLVFYAESGDGCAQVKPNAVALRLDLAASGALVDTVKVGIHRLFTSDVYEVPARTVGAHGLSVEAVPNRDGVTLTVSCPTCKSN
ncbi:hypothetical protein ACO2Q0_13340 [Phenylobacterium sp. VNQ135]|uniref:hypothetical protein n=1 Tax=Phenylobacterium sp. VNQ135 TaxID=3400922 RepID=UPI003C08986A